MAALTSMKQFLIMQIHKINNLEASSATKNSKTASESNTYMIHKSVLGNYATTLKLSDTQENNDNKKASE